MNVAINSVRGEKLVNIDNGGTLTDICVIDGDRVYRTKTLTTPHDLSKCLFDGLSKASRLIYGREDLSELLLSTRYIRYSTTQGTNALVERKGPRVGLLLCGGEDPAVSTIEGVGRDLFQALIGERVGRLDAALARGELASAAVRAVNALGSLGANRIVVAFSGPGREAREAELKKDLLRAFPPHLLGALPILYSHELTEDDDYSRRTWTAIVNAFLHPSMERFLYNAEHKLRQFKTRNPLLIFRNDGYSARVARTVAVKTYSSGPRGGMEGAKAFAMHYGIKRLLTMDIGGTTTDIGLVEDGRVRAHRYGRVQGVPISFPLCDVISAGVGGSSILTVDAGRIRVGPDSVGSAPGPACFGLGGREATMTDAFLAQQLLDPASFFGGAMKIDVERARAAVAEKIAKPLGVTEAEALDRMEAAWIEKVVVSLKDYAPITADAALGAFGGAGPFVVCKIAEAAGIREVFIPGLAAVFSAFGIGFSDVGHEYSTALPDDRPETLAAGRELLRQRAARGMASEGADVAECRLEEVASVELNGRRSLTVTAVKPLEHARIGGAFGGSMHPAIGAGVRRIRIGGAERDVPLYRVEEQMEGATASGPAVLEEAFFTCRIEAGWRFDLNDAGDIRLTRATAS